MTNGHLPIASGTVGTAQFSCSEYLSFTDCCSLLGEHFGIHLASLEGIFLPAAERLRLDGRIYRPSRLFPLFCFCLFLVQHLRFLLRAHGKG